MGIPLFVVVFDTPVPIRTHSIALGRTNNIVNGHERWRFPLKPQ
jgi:hypothetical protein